MRDLFRAANLSPGAVYRYFSGKDELVSAVAAEATGVDEAILETAAAVETSTAEGLGRVLAAALAAGPGLDPDLRSAARHSPGVADALRQRRRRAVRDLAARLGGPGRSRTARARLLLALCDGLAQARALEPETELQAAAQLAARLLSAPHDG